MKKRIISLFLAALMLLLLPAVVAAETPQTGGTALTDWEYTADDEAGTVTLTRYIGEAAVVTVPGSFASDGQTYTTVLATESVFRANTGITSVTLGADVRFLNNSMSRLFSGCSALTAADLTAVNTAGVTDMSYIFYNCSALRALDVSAFNTASPTTIRSMFYNCSSLTSLTGYENWDTSNVDEMNFVFYNCSALTSLDVSGFSTSAAATLRCVFYGCANLTALTGLENWDTSNVADMSYMFYGCAKLTSLDVSSLETDSAEAFRCMFGNCTRLASVTGLENWNTSQATDISYLFYNCSALTAVNLSAFDTAQVTTIRAMFSGCTHLSSMTGIENWNTASLTNMSFAFNNVANALSASVQVCIDLSRWDLDQIENTGWCFQNCRAQQILVPENIAVMSAGFMNHAVRYAGTTYTIPAGVKKIGYAHTFYDFATNDFTEFIVAEGNTAYKTIDGVLYSADGKEMLAVPRNKPFENGVFEIAEGVDFLGELSFSRNYNIHTVVLPDSYEIEYVPVYDDRYIVFEDTGNLNAGSNLSIAIYCYTGITDYAVKETNPRYASADGIIYSKDMTHVTAIPARYNRVMNIPEGVTHWDADAMWADGSDTVDNLLANCTGVTLPASLQKIEKAQLEMLNRIHLKRAGGSNPFTITLAEGNTAFYFDENGCIYPEEPDAYGDVNDDGRVDGEDAVLVRCITEGLLTQADFRRAQFAAADYDRDGAINEADVAALEAAGLLGTVSTLNIEQTEVPPES